MKAKNMEGVAIVITQNGVQVGSTLYTNASGQAFTTLPPGNYTASFTASGRSTVTTNFTITQNDNYMIFVYPDTTITPVTSVPEGIYAVTDDGLYQWDGTSQWLTRALNTYPLGVMALLDGQLYSLSYNGYLYEWDQNNTWTQQTDGFGEPTSQPPLDLMTLGTDLYACASEMVLTNYGRLLKWDQEEETWTEIISETSSRIITGIVVYDGSIYCVNSYNGRLLKWDIGESSWTTLTSSDVPYSTGVNGLVVFNDKLYSTDSSTNLREYSPLTGNCTIYSGATSQTYGLIVFQEKLYVGKIGSADLYEWGGSTSFTLKVSRAGSTINAFTVYNNKLYAVTSGGQLLEWDGGTETTWALKATGVSSIHDVIAVEA